ncbi:HNH endonuclease [Blastococcus sp. CT_GayMR19]|uniref:HNH endonuclease signature motif containing protein n=1 Tax=Blastococcus sp. CT_GayMR19 TaxID=2559608 RepID=UPI001073B768|nr:HNH endonuclease signature motif containing protein [Blastococcus sp. CT_GayMR19]TFV72919.1 HNH endonuclease [Blastococcus sp. CT_GayMR19]
MLQQIAELDPRDFDPADLADEQLRETMPLTQVAINRLSAVLTRCVAAGGDRQVHAADGMGTMKTWLTAHCRLSGAEATALVRAACRLPSMPELQAAYAAGAVGSAHVQMVTAAVTPARIAAAADAGIDLATTDQVLTEAARVLGPEDTAKAARRWVAGVDPDGLLDDSAGLPRVLRMASSSGGPVYLTRHLDPVGGETVHAALEAVMNGYRPADDRRSHAERQGDALVELCRQALAGGSLPTVRGERAQVRVSMDLQALSAERGFAELPFAGPITAETARRLACDASVVRIVTGPSGLPLDVGREQRTASAGIRRAIEVRDVHCVFAGCRAPAAWCDVHHVIHWAFGGVTSRDNGALLCERHHTAVHEGRFSIARAPGTAVWHTFRPDGTEILIRGKSP